MTEDGGQMKARRCAQGKDGLSVFCSLNSGWRILDLK